MTTPYRHAHENMDAATGRNLTSAYKTPPSEVRLVRTSASQPDSQVETDDRCNKASRDPNRSPPPGTLPNRYRTSYDAQRSEHQGRVDSSSVLAARGITGKEHPVLVNLHWRTSLRQPRFQAKEGSLSLNRITIPKCSQSDGG